MRHQPSGRPWRRDVHVNKIIIKLTAIKLQLDPNLRRHRVLLLRDADVLGRLFFPILIQSRLALHGHDVRRRIRSVDAVPNLDPRACPVPYLHLRPYDDAVRAPERPWNALAVYSIAQPRNFLAHPESPGCFVHGVGDLPGRDGPSDHREQLREPDAEAKVRDRGEPASHPARLDHLAHHARHAEDGLPVELLCVERVLRLDKFSFSACRSGSGFIGFIVGVTVVFIGFGRLRTYLQVIAAALLAVVPAAVALVAQAPAAEALANGTEAEWGGVLPRELGVHLEDVHALGRHRGVDHRGHLLDDGHLRHGDTTAGVSPAAHARRVSRSDSRGRKAKESVG